MLILREAVQSIAPQTLKFEEAKHPRDKDGKFTQSATITVDGRQIEVVKPRRARTDQLVPINVIAFDDNFSKSPSFYLGVGGGINAIGNRYARFGEFIAQNDSIESPEVYVNNEGVVGFTNGRHRYAWLRDHGLTSIPVAMEAESVRNAKKYGYLAAIKMAWDESRHPRDKDGQFAVSGNRPSEEPPTVGPRIGFIASDGKEHVGRKTGGLGGFSEDHTDTARRLLNNPNELNSIRKMLEQGAIRYWVKNGELALNFQAGHPEAVKHALQFLHDNYQDGDRIYLDVERGDPEIGHFFDNLGHANRAIRMAERGDYFDKLWASLKQEHAFGNTQIQIDPHSSAALALNMARDTILDSDTMGTGKDVDPNHVTVRFGLVNDNLDALRSFLASQQAFEARVTEVELFPASTHSDGAVPVVARIASPELEALEEEIWKHADFKEKSFPVYKPHCTLAYCKPEAALKYQDLPVGGLFVVSSVMISHASGVKETIHFGMTQKWDESKHKRQPKGSSRGGEFAVLYGPRDALDSLLNGEHNVSIDRNNVRAFLQLAGEQHEDPDLTDLQVEGMQIFGGNGLGIEREDMPQIPPEHRMKFLQYLEDEGVTITEEQVSPFSLKPTQNKISARRVALKLARYEKGDKKFPSVLVSEQSRILDGHHHWGMMAAFALDFPKATMPVFRIHVGTNKALALMHAYMKLHGLKRVTLSGAAVKWDESQHFRDAKGRFWHGSPSGDLRGGALGLHVGSYEAAKQALEARIGIPATGSWDGTREYGKTLLAGRKTLLRLDPKGYNQTGQNAGAPEEDYYPPGEATYGDRTKVPLTVKPNIMAVEITGPMANTIDTPVEDDYANSRMRGQITRGQAKRGYFYTQIGEDVGSISAVVPSQTFIRVMQPAQKADPATGRYVTPFVSFEKQGDDQLRLIASLNSSRLSTWGFTAEAETLGQARYRVTAVLDGRTSNFCRFIDGKIFEVSDAREKVVEALNVQDPEDLRVVQPWPKQTKAAMAEFEEMGASELTERGLHIPPYHPYCRTLLKSMPSSKGVPDPIPALPDDVEVFQPVTQEDLLEMGVEATQEEVDQWNTYVGMSPVELLTKLTGMPPQEVMTKGQGVGATPISFGADGNIGFKASGEVSGVEFKLGAILDPFTGIYYLSQADLLKGTPKAELSFLKNLFLGMIDTGIDMEATSVAVEVAGNASYYAKMGFLPDEVEWDSMRTYALGQIETGNLEEVMSSLEPEDRQLVTQLLQDRSVSALSALVDLPFTYEGRSIGEWIIGDISGAWELDLSDEMLVDQARGYLQS